MALRTINLGTYANDGTGDDLRTAFEKVRDNFTELYSTVFGANLGSAPPTSGVEDGELWWSTVEGRLYIYYSGAWIDASPVDGFVEYNLTAETTTGGATLRINGTDLSADDIKFASGTNITVARTDANTITLSSTSYTGNVTGNLTGDVSGNLTGNVTGNLTGDVSGNASTVTNGVYTTSSINALADVNTVTTPPTSGQALVWNGTNWVPGTVATTGGSGSLDFGTFTAPAGFTLDMGTF